LTGDRARHPFDTTQNPNCSTFFLAGRIQTARFGTTGKEAIGASSGDIRKVASPNHLPKVTFGLSSRSAFQ
jgi:hypothetical protein